MCAVLPAGLGSEILLAPLPNHCLTDRRYLSAGMVLGQSKNADGVIVALYNYGPPLPRIPQGRFYVAALGCHSHGPDQGKAGLFRERSEASDTSR